MQFFKIQIQNLDFRKVLSNNLLGYLRYFGILFSSVLIWCLFDPTLSESSKLISIILSVLTDYYKVFQDLLFPITGFHMKPHLEPQIRKNYKKPRHSSENCARVLLWLIALSLNILPWYLRHSRTHTQTASPNFY